MACAAGTMFTKGLTVDNAIDMVKLMEPLAGQLAVSMSVAGIVCAGVSSLFPIIVLGPWLISDFLGIDRDLTKRLGQGYGISNYFMWACGAGFWR